MSPHHFARPEEIRSRPFSFTMRMSINSSAVVGIALFMSCAGCSKDPLAGRKALDLEQALHGHWSSTRDLELAPSAEPWDTTSATEQWHAEIDLYIDAQSEPKVWAGMGGDRNWRATSQDSTTGIIEVETWPVGQPTKTATIEMQFDASRITMLEKLPAKKSPHRAREWNYINDQAIQP
jgi:hypothetical protein